MDFTYHKEVDINYCSTFGHLSENQIKELIINWAILNETTYCDKYNEKFEGLHNFIRFKFSGKTINTYQCLKYLQCLHYNIEEKTIKTPKLSEEAINALQLLTKGIEEILTNIVALLPEWETAQWSEVCENEITEKPTKENFSLSTRDQRRQLRLDKAVKTHARNTKRGNTARYY
jgi:hypothetical protein